MVAESTDESGGRQRFAAGGLIPAPPAGPADDRIPAWLTRDCLASTFPAAGGPYDTGGDVLPPGATLRNDTGRPLRRDEWHLLTAVHPPERVFTPAEIEQIGRRLVDGLIAAVAPDVDEGRTVPASPTGHGEP